jgi:deoxycytidylate deaminase
MKNDTYLNLCLEQAANSPLRYRHGCIVVRGGKVIGQGYNDYRSGYDGGALKSGRLPLRAATASAAQPKKAKDSADQTFMPFETVTGGGGRLANTPLSMHSEMMAIHSALSTSSKGACSAVSSQKPCFKLSGSSKRGARLRNEAIKSYVKTICTAALAQSAANHSVAKWQVQDWRCGGTASQSFIADLDHGVQWTAAEAVLQPQQKQQPQQ